MNNYITGNTIKSLREKKKMTQSELADKLNVSNKAVSKWETGRGYPDISLLESLAKALGVSVIELISGDTVVNTNRSFNLNKAVFYVCPVCSNIIVGTGESVVCCHGITLPACEAETFDKEHSPKIATVEDEYYITFNHTMEKEHYISFVAAVSDNGVNLVKLYPEQNAEVRFKINRVSNIFAYCNKHGLFKLKI